jgi:hypothetical protein
MATLRGAYPTNKGVKRAEVHASCWAARQFLLYIHPKPNPDLNNLMLVAKSAF